MKQFNTSCLPYESLETKRHDGTFLRLGVQKNSRNQPDDAATPTHRNGRVQLHQPRLWFCTGGYLVKRWFIPAAARARGQSNDLNREILASNLFNCFKEVTNAPPVPSISRCIHIVYRHKNVWEYQWSNFIHNCMSTFLHYVHCKDALLDCSAPGGERCESLTWVDEITLGSSRLFQRSTPGSNFTQATPQATQGRTMKLSMSGPLGLSGTLGETDCVTQYRPLQYIWHAVPNIKTAFYTDNERLWYYSLALNHRYQLA